MSAAKHIITHVNPLMDLHVSFTFGGLYSSRWQSFGQWKLEGGFFQVSERSCLFVRAACDLFVLCDYPYPARWLWLVVWFL